MDWVFDSFVTWLLKCITGVFDQLTKGFFEFFNLEIAQFYKIFPILKDLYASFVGIGIGLIILLVTMRLLRNLLSAITDDYEDPLKLIFRTILAIFLVVNASNVVQYEFKAIHTPYNIVSSAFATTNESDASWSEIAKAMKEDSENDEENDESTTSTVVKDLMVIGLLVAIFFNFFRMLLEAAERYVVICLSHLFAPLVFATICTKETAKATLTFIKVIFNELLLMCFNIVFVKGTIAALQNFANPDSDTFGGKVTTVIHGFDEKGFATTHTQTMGNVFTFCILILAFLIAGQKMDQYMRQIGLDVVQTGGLLDEIRSGLMWARRTIPNAVSLPFRAVKGAGRVVGSAISGGKKVIRGGKKAADGMSRLGRSLSSNDTSPSAFRSLANPTGKKEEQLKADAKMAMGSKMSNALGIENSSLNASKNGKAVDVLSGANQFTLASSATKPNGAGWQALTDNVTGNQINDGKDKRALWIKSQNKNLGNEAMLGMKKGQSVPLLKSTNKEGKTTGLLHEANGQKISSILAANRIAASAEDIIATSLGNGDNMLYDNNGKSLGRLVTPDTALFSSNGCNVMDNGMGGQVGFIPAGDTSGVTSEGGSITPKFSAQTNKTFVTDGNDYYSTEDVMSSLSSNIKKNNISTVEMPMSVGISDGNFVATYYDGIGSTKTVSTSIQDSGIEKLGDVTDLSEYRGIEGFIDAQSYETETGARPTNIKWNDNHQCLEVQREDGQTDYLQDVVIAANGKGSISGGSIFGEGTVFTRIKKYWNSDDEEKPEDEKKPDNKETSEEK